jgi:ribonuclease R
MKQAVYSETHGIHYGLASMAYTHFTSPIRRYPDLVVHRLLRWALQVEQGVVPALGSKEREALEKELMEICDHCSYRERLAADAERESIKLKQVRLAMAHVGSEFDGKIIGMVDSGLFVQLQDPYIEGMVHKDSLTDDFYEWNEDRMVFYGKRKRRTFRIGDPIRILIQRADVDTRQIDLGWVHREGHEVDPHGPSNRSGR